MGKNISGIVPPGCNPFNEEESEDNFYHHREARILSEQELQKYYGDKETVETGIVSDYYDTDEESESEDADELYEKMRIKIKNRTTSKLKKQEIVRANKIEKELVNELIESMFDNED